MNLNTCSDVWNFCPFAHTLTASELSYPGAEGRQIYRRFQVCKAAPPFMSSPTT